MVASDNFAQGMAYLLMFAAGILFVAIVLEIPVLYWILKRISNRNIQLVILAAALLPGYAFFMNLGGPAIALAFIGPVATLVPLVVRAGGIDSRFGFKRIILVYGAVILFEILLLFAFLKISIFWGSASYSFNPVFKSAQYVAFVLLDILFAFTIYRLLPQPRIEDTTT
jgi:hypothetical protein